MYIETSHIVSRLLALSRHLEGKGSEQYRVDYNAPLWLATAANRLSAEAFHGRTVQDDREWKHWAVVDGTGAIRRATSKGYKAAQTFLHAAITEGVADATNWSVVRIDLGSGAVDPADAAVEVEAA